MSFGDSVNPIRHHFRSVQVCSIASRMLFFLLTYVSSEKRSHEQAEHMKSVVSSAIREMPIASVATRSSLKRSTLLQPNDMYSIINLSRQSASIENLSSPSAHALGTFTFVPAVILAMLQSKYSDDKSLYRVLSEPWVQDWNGWCEARRALCHRCRRC